MTTHEASLTDRDFERLFLAWKRKNTITSEADIVQDNVFCLGIVSPILGPTALLYYNYMDEVFAKKNIPSEYNWLLFKNNKYYNKRSYNSCINKKYKQASWDDPEEVEEFNIFAVQVKEKLYEDCIYLSKWFSLFANSLDGKLNCNFIPDCIWDNCSYLQRFVNIVREHKENGFNFGYKQIIPREEYYAPWKHERLFNKVIEITERNLANRLLV